MNGNRRGGCGGWVVGLLCVIVALGWILYNPGDALFGLAGGLLLVCAIWLVFGLLRGGLHRRPPR